MNTPALPVSSPSFTPSTEGAAPDWPHWYQLTYNYRLSLGEKLALLKHFRLAERIFAASHDELASVIGHARALDLRERRDDMDKGIAATAAWLAGGTDRSLLSLADPRYPPRLLHLSDPPLLLYVAGRTGCLGQAGLAVVGSRSATPQGIENARAFSRTIGEAGYSIVSGLALGIDGAAHEGALQSGAPTIALIGTGIDRVYPAAHRDLARRIAGQGAIVSELPLGTPPLQQNFPRRNRLIAALAQGVLVVEAARQSGSLITARLALEVGREVFAIPGSIHSPVSKGCHQLIRQGAKLAECGQDIIEELRPSTVSAELFPRSPDRQPEVPASLQDLPALPLPNPLASPVEPSDDPVLRALGFDPVLLSELLKRCNLPPGLVNRRLLELELDGRIARLDDGRLLQIAEAS